MRIDRLRISSFRNLREFDIDFDETQPTTVLLGRNGLGKSNLVEAIVLIFREMEQGKATEFAYEIDYVCWDKQIHVSCDPARERKKLTITVDGKPWAPSSDRKGRHRDPYRDVLPRYVFSYYSGWNGRLEALFEPPTRALYRGILSGDDLRSPRFFFCRKEYSQLALLAFFWSDDEQSRRSLLEDDLRIRAFESALFVLREPHWVKTRAKPPGVVGDPLFWNAHGEFLPFLDRLWNAALAPIRRDEEVRLPVPRGREHRARLYLYLKDIDSLRAMRSEFDNVALFFGQLTALYVCDLLEEVRIQVQKTDGSVVRFSHLSEGEQQLLTVLGMLRFTQDDEALYLLDEPDTHLNPAWTHEFLGRIQKAIRPTNSQLVITTHNPLMIGSLHRNQVRVLEQHERGIHAVEPEQDPIGMGVEGLLKSELYGLRSSLATEVLEKIDEHYRLLGLEHPTDKQAARTRALAWELSQLGVNLTFPNPYFEQFATAMRNRQPKLPPVLSKVDLERQTQIAREILDEIIAEERQAGRKAKR